jgi:hypothetical protein
LRNKDEVMRRLGYAKRWVLALDGHFYYYASIQRQ